MFLPWIKPWDLFQSNTPKQMCSYHFIHKTHKIDIQIRSLFVAKFFFIQPPNFLLELCFYQASKWSSRQTTDWSTFLWQDILVKNFLYLNYFGSDIFQRNSVKPQIFKGIFSLLCRIHHCGKRTSITHFHWTSKTETVYL